MEHPFEVGQEYCNRIGRYEVLDIQEPKMRICYKDGREQLVTISTQARIWQAMNDEAQQEEAAAKVRSGGKKRRTPARQGYDFDGLQESDFKHNVAGTHWRSRESLGGRLAQQLSETTRFEFESRAIYRRASVYVYLPDYYDPNLGAPFAKYELRLSPEGAQYGLYIERADQSRRMDSIWHWRPFLEAVETDEQLQKQLLQAMAQYDLFWLLQVEEGEGDNYELLEEIKVGIGAPLLWNGIEEIDWPEFASRLRAVPTGQWLNVHLCGWTDKEHVIGTEEKFADQVTAVFRAILPLYLASAGA